MAEANANDVSALKAKVDFLSAPGNYPDATKVDVLETHMSWVFLTDHYVYKLKKPVRYDFLDFTTAEARRKYCREEIRINQPMAADIYIRVVAITMDGDNLELGGKGSPVDWLVKMKRLPAEHLLHNALKKGSVSKVKIKQVADILTDFYISSSPISTDPESYRRKMTNDIFSNQRELLREEFGLEQVKVNGIARAALAFIENQAALFDQRIAEGRIIEGHGDLRPEHICLSPQPVVIDRLEFDRALRIIDVAEELSFLTLECEMLASPSTGLLFFNSYQSRSHDEIPEILVAFYKSKRALLRARLSIHHLLEKKYLKNEKKWRDRTNAYLSVAAGCAKKLNANG